MLGSPDTGTGSIFQRNPYYDPTTGRWISIACATALKCRSGYGRSRRSRVTRRGLVAVFIDGDGNGTFNKDADYGFWVVYDSPSAGQPRKAFYFPTIIREARDRKVFGFVWPSHIATFRKSKSAHEVRTPCDKYETRFAASRTLRSLYLSPRLIRDQ